MIARTAAEEKNELAGRHADPYDVIRCGLYVDFV